jgi:transcription elongation factor Elf1
MHATGRTCLDCGHRAVRIYVKQTSVMLSECCGLRSYHQFTVSLGVIWVNVSWVDHNTEMKTNKHIIIIPAASHVVH